MKINLLPTYQVQRVENKNQQPKQVSFGSDDEFIKTTVEETFKEAKKAIQKKYQPAISQLRDRKKTIAQDVREKVTKELFGDESVRDGYEAFSENKKFSNSPTLANRKSIQKLKEILRRFKIEYHSLNDTEVPNASFSNCIMLTSKDKKLAEDVMEFTKFYTKATEVFPSPSMTDKDLFGYRASFHRTCYETLKDTFGDDTGSFHEAILNAMEKAGERYKETGNPTVLHIENMERLLDETKNESSDIAIMKDLMDKCGRYFHTMFTFTNTDPSKSDPGTMVSHRVGSKFDIDELGIKSSNIDFYGVRDEFKNAVENASKIYKEGSEEYISITKQIEDLQAQCKREVAQAKKTLPKGSNVKRPTQPTPPPPPPPNNPNKLKELINKAIKKVKENKKAVIIIGAVVAGLAATGIILHKKGKLKNQEATTNQSQQPPKVQNTATSNILKTETPKIFSDFQI